MADSGSDKDEAKLNMVDFRLREITRWIQMAQKFPLPFWGDDGSSQT